MLQVIFANRSTGYVEEGVLKKLIAKGSVVAYRGSRGWVIARWFGKRVADNWPPRGTGSGDSP